MSKIILYTIFSGLLLATSFIPVIIYYYWIGRKSNSLYEDTKSDDFTPRITVYLPVRNEETNISRKIDEVISMDYPKEKLEILVIDSDSEDGTSELARQKLSEVENGVKWRVIDIATVGKSKSVNIALEIIETDYFVMMDADAYSPKDSLSLLMSHFVEDDIGAVCGCLKISKEHSDYPYRVRFNKIRQGESNFISTPIFEGSICAYRVTSIRKKIDDDMNADDTQLALISRANGYRSIMDPRIVFTEESLSMPWKRKIRRAQGLVRALYRNRKNINLDKFGIVYSYNFYFYIGFPWMLFASIVMVALGFMSDIANQEYGNTPSVIVAGAIFTALINRTTRGLVLGCLALLHAQITALLGITYEKWNPDR